MFSYYFVLTVIVIMVASLLYFYKRDSWLSDLKYDGLNTKTFIFHPYFEKDKDLWKCFELLFKYNKLTKSMLYFNVHYNWNDIKGSLKFVKVANKIKESQLYYNPLADIDGELHSKVFTNDACHIELSPSFWFKYECGNGEVMYVEKPIKSFDDVEDSWLETYNIPYLAKRFHTLRKTVLRHISESLELMEEDTALDEKMKVFVKNKIMECILKTTTHYERSYKYK